MDEENIKEPDTALDRAYTVFINHVDEFIGLHFAQYITLQPRGALASQREEIEGEGGENVAEEETEERKKLSLSTYKVIGTRKRITSKIDECITRTITFDQSDDFANEILKCDCVIYDITTDPNNVAKALATLNVIEKQLRELKEVGPRNYENSEKVYVFILISSVLTWAKSKAPDPDDPEVPFMEADYKRRRPHPNYKNEIDCERKVVQVGKEYKEKLKVYIVCCGLLYGFKEDVLKFYFKMAWRNEEYLPIFNGGNNYVPFLHIEDLAKTLHAVIELQPKKPQYILAVEQTPCKFKQVIKALSKVMGSGKVREDVTKEEAFLYNNFTQSLYDAYTLNLRMEPMFITEELNVQFKYDLNIAENMSKIVDEFRLWRNLRPFRILLHGPPVSGKTILAKQICEKYGLHYISVKTMIEETKKSLRDLIDYHVARKKEKAKQETVEREEADEEEVEEEDEDGMIEELTEKLRDIEQTIENSDDGKLPDEQVVRLLKEFLGRNFCKNQGYVLDGYPKNIAQTKELFGMDADIGGEGGMDEGDEEEGAAKATIIPTHVISLEAPDEYLYEKVMNFPEAEVQGTHYTEEHMIRRAKRFRLDNTEDNTLLIFFDENEIHPKIIDVTTDHSKGLDRIFERICEFLGLVVGFGPTDEELASIMECEEENKRLSEERERLSKILFEEQALEDYQNMMMNKIQLLEQLQLEEEKILAVKCEPLRNYLMRYVFPTLTEGLLEVARVKPNDPVDYLAEYLFKMNPEGKMFDPAYTRQGKLIEHFIKDNY